MNCTCSEKSKGKHQWNFIVGVFFHLSQGLRNDLKAALDKIDQQYLNELVGGQEPGEEDTQNDLKVHEENTTIEELEVISAPTWSHYPVTSFIPWGRCLSSSEGSVQSTLPWSVVITNPPPFSYFMLLFIHSLFPHSPLTLPYFLPSEVVILLYWCAPSYLVVVLENQ